MSYSIKLSGLDVLHHLGISCIRSLSVPAYAMTSGTALSEGSPATGLLVGSRGFTRELINLVESKWSGNRVGEGGGGSTDHFEKLLRLSHGPGVGVEGA